MAQAVGEDIDSLADRITTIENAVTGLSKNLERLRQPSVTEYIVRFKASFWALASASAKRRELKLPGVISCLVRQ